jgi:hypothetical protein
MPETIDIGSREEHPLACLRRTRVSRALFVLYAYVEGQASWHSFTCRLSGDKYIQHERSNVARQARIDLIETYASHRCQGNVCITMMCNARDGLCDGLHAIWERQRPLTVWSNTHMHSRTYHGRAWHPQFGHRGSDCADVAKAPSATGQLLTHAGCPRT